MMHSTGNQNSPFVVIPESENDRTPFDWRLKAAAWGFGALATLSIAGKLLGTVPRAIFAAPEVTHYQAPAAGSSTASARAALTEKRASPPKVIPLAAAKVTPLAPAAKVTPLAPAAKSTPSAPAAKSTQLAPATKSAPLAATAGVSKSAAPPAASAAPAYTAPPPVRTPPSPAEPKVSAVIPLTLVDSAVDAYGSTRYDAAAAMLRRALSGRGPDSLNAPRRATALMFLGAAEWSRQSLDSATAAFRTLLVEAPRYTPDAPVLSRPVLDFYGKIRRSVYGVARVQEREQGVTITVIGINPHRVSVDVCGEDGSCVARIYDGPSADSLSFTWDRRVGGAAVAANAHYEIVVTARGQEGQPVRVTRFPLATR